MHGIIAFGIATVLLGCGAPEPVGPDAVRGPFTWAGLTGVMQMENLWLSGQPDEAALQAARRAGIDVVIDLREPDEYPWNEKESVERMGLAYYNVPVPGNTPFARQTFRRIDALVAEHANEKILLYCSSGNRAAAWLSAHLVEHRGMGIAEALAVGRKAGMTKPSILENVTRLVSGAPSVDAGPSLQERTTPWLRHAAYQDRFALEVQRGNYPVRVEGRLHEQHPGFRATLEPIPSRSFGFHSHHGLGEAEFEARHAELEARGYTRVWAQDFVDERGRRRFQGTWVK